jgi:hypothetical protein
MKKNLIKLLKKQQLIISLSIVFSVILIILVAPALLLRFNSWRTLVGINSQESKKLETISNNVALLQGVDTTKVESYSDLVEKLTPQEADQLRAVSLIDKLVKKSGVSLDSIKVGSGAEGQTAATPAAGAEAEMEGAQPGAPTSATPTQDTSGATATAATTTPTTPAASSSDFSMSLSFEGSFTQTLKFLGLLGSAKRAIGAKDITLSKKADSNKLVVTIDLTLPLAKESEVTPQDQVELTTQDIEALEALLSKAAIDAKPTKLPTGRTNPFN